MSSVDTRPLPVTILRWPRTKNLISQQKGILMYLFAGPEQTACGCYLLPIDGYAGDLSMSPSSLEDAVAEFTRRGLVDYDAETGEILLIDWFRWYRPNSPSARGAADTALARIQSCRLKEKAQNLYKSTPKLRKGKGKGEGISARHGNSQPAADHSPFPASGGGPAKKRRTVMANTGVVCWTDEDALRAEGLEADFGVAALIAAVEEVVRQGVEPLPYRVMQKLKDIQHGDCSTPNSGRRPDPDDWADAILGFQRVSGEGGIGLVIDVDPEPI